MKTDTIKKAHRFGKLGSIITMILAIVTAIMTVAAVIATVFTASLPEDAVVVSMKNNAEISINAEKFDTFWNMLADGFSYSSSDDPSGMLSDGEKINPPEDQEMRMNISFFNNDFSSAVIRTQDGRKVIDAVTDASVYRSGDLVVVLAFIAVFLVSVVVSLWILRGLFKVIQKCETPFSEALVKKMKLFSFSLLPVAVCASIAETLSASFMSAGRDAGICIQWGVIIAFAVAMCLVTVFNYGVRLQRESDETL